MTDTRPRFLAPRTLLERKPPHGSPCTSCGLCCLATLCDVAREVHRRTAGPCPSLKWDADGSRCGIVDDAPPKYRAAALLLIRAGQGCDARFNGEEINHSFNYDLDQFDAAHRDEIAAAKKLWSVK